MRTLQIGRDRRDMLLAVSLIFNLAVLFGVAYAAQGEPRGGPPGAGAPGGPRWHRPDGPPGPGGWRDEGDRPGRHGPDGRRPGTRMPGGDGEPRRGPFPGGPGGPGAGAGGGPLAGFERLAGRLGFDETQRAQFEQLHEERVKRMVSIDERSRSARRAMFEALTLSEANGATLRDLAEKELSIERERRMAQIDLFEQFNAILTAEQRTQLREDLKRMSSFGGPRGPRGGEREGDRGPERAGDRDGDRRPDRGPERDGERGPDRGPERGADRGPPPGGPDGAPGQGRGRGSRRGPASAGGPPPGHDQGPPPPPPPPHEDRFDHGEGAMDPFGLLDGFDRPMQR